jgi:hypothetical protein
MPEITTVKIQEVFSQKRTVSESAEEVPSLLELPAETPERRLLRYANKRTNTANTRLCGK